MADREDATVGSSSRVCTFTAGRACSGTVFAGFTQVGDLD